MDSFRKHGAGAQRFAERRLREDEAPRLSAAVPDLLSLSLAIEDCSDSSFAQPKHVRRVVVAQAPALFVIGCSDPNCQEGGHDVTHPIMQALTRHQTAFHGEDKCYGILGSSQCTRVLRYEALANYANGSSQL
jgi:hypothetical protein